MNEPPKVLITNAVPADVCAPVDGIAQVIMGPDGGDLMARDEVLRLAPTLSAIINQAELRVDAELLDAAPRLKIVANVAIGTDNLDKALMAARGVWATNTPDIFTEATADCAFGLLIGAARRLAVADRYVRSGAWSGFQPGMWDGALLHGKTLGIVGYGRIGQAVAKRAVAFGMRVIYHTRDDAGSIPLDDLLAQADFVSLHVPLTPETRHLLDARRLARMKRGAYLINVARGAVVDEAALVAALQSGHLAGAGLDVFEHEPQVHPGLLAMEDVMLSPHIGGGTVESRRAGRRLCFENVAAALRGDRPLTPVNQVG